MLSESLLKQAIKLQQLQLQQYKKVINYSINLILNRDNQMKLHQFIQINEEEGDLLTQICLSIINSLAKYRSSSKQFQNDIILLPISKDKIQYLKQKIKSNLYQLRKIIYHDKLCQITQLQDLQWRMQIEIARKHAKNLYEPSMLLNFKIKQKQTHKNITMNSDYANLKNLHDNLLDALKMHRSAKFKVARNCSV